MTKKVNGQDVQFYPQTHKQAVIGLIAVNIVLAQQNGGMQLAELIDIVPFQIRTDVARGRTEQCLERVVNPSYASYARQFGRQRSQSCCQWSMHADNGIILSLK